MAEVQKLWVPEKPENQSVKLECLKLACGGVLKQETKEVLPAAQAMYDWIMSGSKSA